MPLGQRTGRGQPSLEGGCGCVVVAMASVFGRISKMRLENRSDLKAESGEQLIWLKWSCGVVLISQSREV